MAGKSWKPSRNRPCGREKQAPVTLTKQWGKKRGGTGEEKQPLGRICVLETQVLEVSADNAKLPVNALWPRNTWNPVIAFTKSTEPSFRKNSMVTSRFCLSLVIISLSQLHYLQFSSYQLNIHQLAIIIM